MKIILELFHWPLLCGLIYAGAELSCRDENGHDVDWLIVYKLPKLHDANGENPYITTGESYAYLSANEIHETGKWILSKQNISSNTSAVARTLSTITEIQNSAYIVYNDEVPETTYFSTTWGHTKGVLSFDDKTGFWLIHSVPKFPVSGHYEFPHGSKEHGQIFICVTYSFSAINQIGNQLLYMKPQIYKRQSNDAVAKLSPLVQSLFTKHPKYIDKPPWYNVVSLTSKSGLPFISFSKHSKFYNDLYDALVAPNLKSSLYTETWQQGRGTPLKSNCSIHFPVWNVRSVNISYYYMKKMKEIEFSSLEDHSKWAVSAKAPEQWICIGDINRMKSQERRGGGTLCFKDKHVWQNFNNAVSHIEKCQRDNVLV